MIIDIKPDTKAARELFFDGQKAFADMELRGMRIDMKRIAENRKEATRLQKDARKLFMRTPEARRWKEWAFQTGREFKPLDSKQASMFLYDKKVKTGLHLKPTSWTDSGLDSADNDALQDIDADFADHLLIMRKMDKVMGTYLAQIEREVEGGMVRPTFNLQLVPTYRSSADSPSAQNQPVRDEQQMQLIRTVYIPDEGFCLGESDFKGVEVGVGICYHHDPVMIKYWNDPTTDMHRDSSCDCFMLKPEQVNKSIRHAGKNKFVFPEFYGSAWAQVAPDLWKAIKRGNLTTNDGTPLYEHLRDKGITKLGPCSFDTKPVKGTFAAHIRDVEDVFWNERFKVYTQWKKEWYKAFLRHGYFNTLTGFRCSGQLRKNQVVNYPIQGDAFHCLLWTLIRMNRWLKREKMRTSIIGQIHDSMLKHYHPEEIRAVILRTQKMIREEIKQAWPWIIVPLDAEFEVGPVNGSWAEKKEYKLENK